jgi:hypothetical protein
MRQEPGDVPSVSFYGPVTGNVNVAGRDLQSHASFGNVGLSGEDLLAALAAALERKDIPWASPGLAEARAPIQRAVRCRNATDPGLRPAVTKLVQVCEGLGVGIASTALFEVLKSFIS